MLCTIAGLATRSLTMEDELCERTDEYVAMDAEPAEGSREKPRLMISKIVCTNFKSYAGVKELGPFHKVKISHNKTLCDVQYVQEQTLPQITMLIFPTLTAKLGHLYGVFLYGVAFWIGSVAWNVVTNTLIVNLISVNGDNNNYVCVYM